MNPRELVGNRLREERLRLRESQESFAAQVGVGKNAQIKYEKGERAPDADYLQLASNAGVDLLYVITGTRRPETAVTAIELKMLANAVNKTSTGDSDQLDMHKVEEAYTAQYERAVAAGKAPAATLTERHLKLLAAFDAASESGKKTIERIAQLEAARPQRKRSTYQRLSNNNIEIKGDANVIGSENSVRQTK